MHESGRPVFLHDRLSDVHHADPAVEQARYKLVPDTVYNRVQIPTVRFAVLTGRWRSCKRAFRSANGVAPVAAVGPTERTDRRNGRVSRARQIKIDRKREYCDLPRKRGELKRTARAYGNRRFRRANRNFTFAGRGKSSRRRLNISVPVRRRGPRGS